MPKIHFRTQGETVPVDMRIEEDKKLMKAEIKKRVEEMKKAGIT